MKVKVKNKIYQFNIKLKAKELLRKLNLQSQSSIVVRNGEVITEDEYIQPEDEVEIIDAISGG
ncbi:thiamine biosynthesis protein ThiS [Candidatus Aerophobetes bacterium]|uniref:Thiamine biosynthesis protein ThiS n=1 Tax=Aerophobetes bacterium TaxID=2030807 RepID=A0A662DHU9_UNCAE|nr:MAG: thiamine biosynthesis protein ThiS [Candidatus Aerophobetes bacterium]